MAVADDVRRLSQMDAIFLGVGYAIAGQPSFNMIWHKGRLQQANDGNWIFRSISVDGTIAGMQLGQINANWTSSEGPTTGIVININIALTSGLGPPLISALVLQQMLPQELS